MALPAPRMPITTRPGVLGDVPFLDSLQKLHTRQVGWMPTAQFEGKIKLGHVLIAESDGEPVGYCIGTDQYFKRDDVGVIYQMNVAPGRQRGLVGATLLKAMFDRAAYGCRLFCCWCAQDIAANRFWEAMGFVPLAFRSGSRRKQRMHIFWQRRVRAGDTTTPYWFPSQTSSGSIREDRLVLPIPPGTHWSEAKPVVLPGTELSGVGGQLSVKKRRPSSSALATGNSQLASRSTTITSGGLRFAVGSEPAVGAISQGTREKREPKRKVKNEPRLIAAARELRDRWLERVNEQGFVLPAAQGKYDVSRALAGTTTPTRGPILIPQMPDRAAPRALPAPRVPAAA